MKQWSLVTVRQNGYGKAMWTAFQSVVVVLVAGTLIRSGATSNGFLAGIIGFGVARVLTVGLGMLLAWTRRPASPKHRSWRPAPGMIASRRSRSFSGRRRYLG